MNVEVDRVVCVLVGLVFVVSLLSKARPAGFGPFREATRALLPPALRRWASAIALVVLGLEATTVAGLAFAWPSTTAALALATVLLFGFTAAVVSALAQGRRVGCACFGNMFSAVIGPETVIRNGILLAGAVAGMLSSDSRWADAFVAALLVLTCTLALAFSAALAGRVTADRPPERDVLGTAVPLPDRLLGEVSRTGAMIALLNAGCPSCEESPATLQRIQEQEGRLLIIGVEATAARADEVAAVEGALDGLPHQRLTHGELMEVANSVGLEWFPTFVAVDGNLRVEAVFDGLSALQESHA